VPVQGGLLSKTGLTKADQINAINTLLQKSLGIRAGDEILIIYDESFSAYLDAFTDCVNNYDLAATYIHIPKSYQLRLAETISRKPEPIWLPNPLRRAIVESSVILNVLDGDLDTGPVRGAVLSQARSKGCRLAHIPGISDDILEIVLKTDFERILRECELVAWFLGCGGEAVLCTYDAAGIEYKLHLDLEDWSNEPLMSPGIINPGSWGNVPPGETFCCPDPASVQGQICINGSIPQQNLGGREIILTFDEGKLVNWIEANKSALTEFFDKQQVEANKYGDQNWATFAELGIGLNPAITRLTGNGLFDEKAAHTIHVALGDNTIFGHAVKSRIHADLVTINPSLTVGKTQIMSKGTLLVENLENIRDKWVAPEIPINPTDRIQLREDEIFEDAGVLYRRLYKSGRIGHVTMVPEAKSRALAKLCEQLQRVEPYTVSDLLDDYPEFDGVDTQELIAILRYYNCLFIMQNGET
jgi:hypothetical protein